MAKGVHEHYRAGLEGFNTWIRALQNGKAGDTGMRYNMAVWLECRQNAVGFLVEAKMRLPGRTDELFDKARMHYAVVTENLGKVAELYPWESEAPAGNILPIDSRSRAAVEALKAAREAEAGGLCSLETIVQAL
ncbi:MAG: hypothetical protein MUF84_07050 [Anaerolineae bacterium]|nr:hypothetical protein [Anaerolineae bacterium]